jgi:hypothetical protein
LPRLESQNIEKEQREMRKNYLLVLTFLVVALFGAQSLSAQITITIPKLPKIKKDKPQPTPQPTPEQSTNTDRNQTNNQSEDNRADDSSDTKKEQGECETNPVARLVVDELTKMREDIDGFTPDRGWFYNVIPTYKYLLMSVSPAARKKWQEDFKEIGNCPKIVAGLDKLGISAAKKLPLRLPDKSNYPVHNLAEEKLMKSKINDLVNHKIHYIGIKQANWLIEKNDYGIPTARYKHGMVWVRYTPNDHPYCRAYYINIIQDYAGGGTYGASYANFIDESLVGCPAGAK